MAKRLCLGCLLPGHQRTSCPAPLRCRRCGGQHPEALHPNNSSTPKSGQRPDGPSGPISRGERRRRSRRQRASRERRSEELREASPQRGRSRSRSVQRATGPSPSRSARPLSRDREGGCLTLSPTLRVAVDAGGRSLEVRASLDACVPTTLISPAVARVLQANHRNASTEGTTFPLAISSLHDPTRRLATFAEVRNIRLLVPSTDVTVGPPEFTDNLRLADPSFGKAAPVSLIIGADVYQRILRQGTLQFPQLPLAQNTIFGWVLSGTFH